MGFEIELVLADLYGESESNLGCLEGKTQLCSGYGRNHGVWLPQGKRFAATVGGLDRDKTQEVRYVREIIFGKRSRNFGRLHRPGDN